MGLFRGLFPAHLSPTVVIVLIVSFLALAGVVVSILIPWWNHSRERERIRRGDY
jgi:hypothetical protein